MALPNTYDPEKIGSLYKPDVTAAVEAGASLGLLPAEKDTERNVVILVDMQIDFVHTDGSLSVPGAVDDTRRTVRWLYENCSNITSIVASLDTHLPLQIFSRTWWADRDGNHPEPNTIISSEAVKAGTWTPLYEIEWSRNYVEQLEAQSRKQLMIWPYHTLVGTSGHNLVPAVYEAITYHSTARQTRPTLLTKGDIPKSEYYSIFEPEVKIDDMPNGGLNEALLDSLAQNDRIFVAGQAKSHCVLETISTMMRYYGPDSSVIRKVHVLTDCMSSVAHPEIDFESIAQETFEAFSSKGLNLNTSENAPIG